MSSQKFLSGKLLPSRTPWQHQPVAWQNAQEYIGVSSILNTPQTFGAWKPLGYNQQKLFENHLVRVSYSLGFGPASSFVSVLSPVSMKATAEQVIAYIVHA